MRSVAVALACGALLCACAAENARPTVGRDDITAAHLRNLETNGSALRLLEPTPQEAEVLAEEEAARAARPPGEEGWAEDHDLEEEPSTQEKAEQASVAVLAVAVTVGAMIAPYFLF